MSSKTAAVSVRNLSKSYTIAHNDAKHTTAAEALVHKLKNPLARPQTETFWALRDVSFDIEQGDVVGIIGRNGAGKSTLLKILSRIAEPTSGEAVLRGRVGSLLEVGTGFHPELTGRENVFLNGAILGMTNREITKQFDAIVDFSGTEKFLDTPVKRYSSGMYVRLAFAVAAHLEPEILIVDEVLAVGDAEFQKKCMGKMQDVAQHGRTILFVSHNMAAVRSLCNRGVMLKNGQVYLNADVETITSEYLSSGSALGAEIAWPEGERPTWKDVALRRGYILNDAGDVSGIIDNRKGFSIVVEYELTRPMPGLRIGFALSDAQGNLLCGSNDPQGSREVVRGPGEYMSRCDFPGYVLNEGRYLVNLGADTSPPSGSHLDALACLAFNIEDTEGHGTLHERLPGIIRPRLHWTVDSTDLTVSAASR